MANQFYLSSHDIGPDSRPRKCKVVNEVVEGMRANSRYVLVEVAPPLTSAFRDGPVRDFNQIILSLDKGRTITDVGTQPVGVEIVLCPTYSEGRVDERACSKIGFGGIHLTYADALKCSPAEVR